MGDGKCAPESLTALSCAWIPQPGRGPTGRPLACRRQLTEGPIGVGTRFRATITSRRRPMDMLLETTLYERPTRLTTTTSMAGARICGTLTSRTRVARG